MLRPLLLLLAIAVACQAQLSSRGLPALEALPSADVLITPDVFTAESFHGAGERGQIEQVSGEADTPSAWRVTVPRACQNKWEIGMGAPCPKAIGEDDVLLLTFWARSLVEGKGNTAEVQAVFRRATKPYKSCLGTTVKIVSGWHCYAIPFSPSYALAAAEGRFYLQLGAKAQILEIRDVCLRSFGKAMSLGVLYRRLDIPTEQGGSKVAGTPLTPATLWEMRAHDGLPPRNAQFEPTGAWQHTYSIWTCHGYVHQGNKRLGVLEVSRTPGNGTIAVGVRQDIVNDEGNITRCTATIICADDAIASLQSWELAVAEIAPDGTAVPELGWQETARRDGEGFDVRISQETFRRDAAARATADWCLFEAVQRLPFRADMPPAFDVLEGLTALKTEHHFTDCGPDEIELAGTTRRLHRFAQIGHGILPYNYWLDEDHRLVMAVTHSRAYILDERADDVLSGYTKGQRARYDKLAARAKARGDGDGK